MAKKKTTKSKREAESSEAPRTDYVRFRTTTAWKEWLDRLSDHCQLTMTDVINQALIRFAREQDFTEPPPKR